MINQYDVFELIFEYDNNIGSTNQPPYPTTVIVKGR